MGTLIRNVKVGDTWWGPAHGNADQVPSDVAEQITNPRVWAADDDVVEAPSPGPGAPPFGVVPDGTVETVLAWVNGAPGGEPMAEGWVDRARAALEVEQAGKNRRGIVDTLTAALPPVGGQSQLGV